jgi:hypothetical protein
MIRSPVRLLGGMWTAIKPDSLSATERLTEIGQILAVGLMRLRGRKSSPKCADCGEISLDILADQSGPDPNIVGGE